MQMEVKQDGMFMQAIGCLPPPRAAELARLDGQQAVEEVRLRVGRPPAVRTATGERETDFPPVTASELRETLSRAARYSVHSYAESLRHGFVTIGGGHRLGLCGTVAEENGQVIGGTRVVVGQSARGAAAVGCGRDHPAMDWNGKAAECSAVVTARLWQDNTAARMGEAGIGRGASGRRGG